MSWLVYRLTGSALLLGTVGFLSQLPAFFFSPLAGVLADRYDKRKMLIVVQSCAMAQAFLLAALVLSGTVRIWQIVALGVMLGFVNAFEMPTRQSFFIDMLDGRKDLHNALVLNSSLVNITRIIGPSLAGILIAAVGEGLCFFFNGVSFIAVLFSLSAMRIPDTGTGAKEDKIISALKSGWAYIRVTPPLLPLFSLLACISLFGMSFQILMPVYVKDVLHAGPRALGFVMGSTGLGALASAIFIASRKNGTDFMPWISKSAILFGGTLVVLSQVKVLSGALVVLPLVGAAMMAQLSASNTTVQAHVKDHMRGRVMAYYSMAFLGVAPFGSLYAGSLAQRLGVENALMFGGVCCALAGSVFAWRLAALKAAGRLEFLENKI